MQNKKKRKKNKDTGPCHPFSFTHAETAVNQFSVVSRTCRVSHAIARTYMRTLSNRRVLVHTPEHMPISSQRVNAEKVVYAFVGTTATNEKGNLLFWEFLEMRSSNNVPAWVKTEPIPFRLNVSLNEPIL